MRRHLAFGAASLAALASASLADWNTVGHDSARFALSPGLGPSFAKVAWEGSLNAVVAQQPFVEGDVVVTARMVDLGDVANGTWIVAHSLSTGALLWQTQLPPEPGSWRNHVVGIQGGQVYATRSGSEQPGFLYALDVSSGSVIWPSVAKLRISTTESPAFAPDGDPVFKGDGNTLVRFDRETGQTVWSVPYVGAASDARSPAIYGNRVYAWDPFVGGWGVQAFDLATGAKLHATGPVGNYGGPVQQAGLFCGLDGTLYVPRIGQKIAAYADTGSAFVLKWETPMGNAVFSNGGVGPDGTIYSYSPAQEVMRLDPATGAVIDLSPPIPSDTFAPRMAIDQRGRVFVTNGGFAQGRVFAFTADLQLLWSDPVVGVNVGGPATGAGETLVVAGTGNRLRAYRDGMVTFGAGTPGCAGTHDIEGTSLPTLGNPSWQLVCTNAPPSSSGLVLFGDAIDSAGGDPFGLGIATHLDFFSTTFLLALDAASDANGLGLAPPVAIPSGPAALGAVLGAQMLWPWPGPCSPSPFGLSATRGLEITLLAP